jgi:iron-sulfur cluster repair protein YtfE (RIC family)
LAYLLDVPLEMATLSTAADWLHHDHRDHEALLHECQQRAELEDWNAVKQLYGELRRSVERHIVVENEIIFAAYEALTDTPEAPTRALRDEHERIRRLLEECAAVLSARDSEQAVESLSVLTEYMLKHHDKEEQVFLPMAGHVLAAQREAILARLKSS